MITNFIFLSSVAMAQNITRLKSEKEILKLRKKAVVQVVIRVEGGKHVGSGFFVSKNKIIASKHTIKPFLENPKSQIAVVHNNELVMDLELGQCGNENHIDICVFRTKNYKSDYYIPASRYEDSFVNEPVTVVGWPERTDSPTSYNLRVIKKWENHKEKTGLINSMKKNNTVINLNMRSLQLSGDSEKGVSGGPAFNSLNGKFRGVTGDIWVKNKKAYDMLIPSDYIYSFLKKYNSFKEIEYGRLIKSYGNYKSSLKSLSEKERLILEAF